MILPSASSLARVDACIASEVIPIRVHTTGNAAERGNEIHAFIDDVAMGKGRSAALEAVPLEWRSTCEGIDVDAIVGGLSGLRTEVAYAIDMEIEAVRVLGHHMGRKYPHTLATEVRGTLDITGIRADCIPCVIDIKTGQDVGPAATNWQLRFFAFCLLCETGAEVVDGRLVYIREDGSHYADCHAFTAEDLLRVPEDLRAIGSRLTKARAAFAATGALELYAGDHCKYCPAQLNCPAKTSIVRSMAGELASVGGAFTEMTAEQLEKAWLSYEQIKPLFWAVDDGLKSVARTRGIDLSDGRTVRAVEVHKTYFSKEKALALLSERGASAEEIAACTRDSVENHVRTLKPKKRSSHVSK